MKEDSLFNKEYNKIIMQLPVMFMKLLQMICFSFTTQGVKNTFKVTMQNLELKK